MDYIGNSILYIRVMCQEGGQEGYHYQSYCPTGWLLQGYGWHNFFFSFSVNKELVTSSAHSFSPAWGCEVHAEFQTSMCKNLFRNTFHYNHCWKKLAKLNLMVSHSHYKSLLFLLCRSALSLKKAMCLNHVGCIFVFLLLIIICSMVIFC